VSEPKRHHYVPQFYLRHFTWPTVKGTRVLCVYDKEGGEPRIQTPLNTAVEQGFYSFETPTGKDNEIEKALSQVESGANPVLSRLAQPGEDLNDLHLPALASFMALTHVRVPRSVKAASEVLAAGARQFLRGSAEDRDAIRRFLADPDTGPEQLDEEEFIKLLREFDDHFVIEANPKAALLQSLSLFPKIAEILLQMNWCLCRAPGSRYFITSDTPLCIFFRPAPGLAGFGGGLLVRSAEVTFPISPGTLLLLSWKQSQRGRSVSANFVREMNRRMAWSCDRYVISNVKSKATAALVRDASITRKHPKMDPDRLRLNMEQKWQKFRSDQHNH